MFSAVEYVKRYEAAPDKQTVEQLQKLVDLSGLGAEEQFVVALLNAVSASDFPLAAAMREIRKALAEAAEIRGLGGWWKEKLDAYVAHIGEEPFEIATFLQGCMSGGLSLDHKDAVAGQALVLPTPLVLVRQPVFEERANVSGLLGDYRYQTDVIEVGMGLFEVAAGLRTEADFKGASKLGILQFASSDRVATYDGVTVGNRFTNALDTSKRPWYKGVSAQIVPGAPTAVAPNDAPRWGLPKVWAKGQKLRGITIRDTFVTHVVMEVAPNKFHKLFTCEWAFTVDYDATNPGAARAGYQVTGQRFESGEIALSGKEPLTGDYRDQVTK
ncbi:hypothetical protein ACBJ59_29890 [Nonomuraea sp. MTCD27]|uniref:hypothetical protein n=1 Tax=Nonomuraea sp. MTCD27 TaxID=1676747 RepID=UPI0035C02C6E